MTMRSERTILGFWRKDPSYLWIALVYLAFMILALLRWKPYIVAQFWSLVLPGYAGLTTGYIVKWILKRETRSFYWGFALLFLLSNAVLAFWTPEPCRTVQWRMFVVTSIIATFYPWGTARESVRDNARNEDAPS